MKCSIITPTNLQNAFLLDLYDCIKNQSYTNWEWVIYLNGEASEVDLPPIIRFGDARIKIFRASNFSQSIGEIKKNAFMLGLGEILVEVDHDDMITPNCLEKLVSAFQDPSVGFAYSNSAVYHHQDSFQPYNPSIGWTYSKFNWKGKSLYAMNTFAPTSHSLQYIWYAPDHVRAWRTTLYLSLKGHNPDYSVCDDHELMIRTFLATKMVHIPEVLYIYRITGDNNWLQRSDLIQQVTVELGDKYIWDLAVKDAKNNKLKVVDLNPRLDVKNGCEKVLTNIEKIPLDNSSVGVINLSHSIQLFKDPIKIMSEIHRVLSNGGWAFIEVPSTDGRGAWQDPTHVSFWNENSFNYYTRKEQASYINNNSIRFVENYKKTSMFPENIAITNVRLIALKSGNRFPGVINI